jgi:hypothetical protein
MKICDLLEARDWQRIADPALKWLAKYTYENLDKWPSGEIIDDLQKRYPANPGVIYRGMNFGSKTEYDNFFSKFDGQVQARIEFNGVSSWTRNADDAKQFAITQPTYFLNREVMVAHGEMTKAKEKLAGYRGLVISMDLPPHTGIDVDQTGVGHESEVVVPSGTWLVKIHQVVKKYSEHLADGDVTPDQVILGASRKQLTAASYPASFVDHVMHHHSHKLSAETRNHVFNQLWPKQGVAPFMYSAEPASRWGESVPDRIDFVYGIPALKLFELSDQGFFVDPIHKAKIKKLAAAVVKTALPVLKKYVVQAVSLDLSPISLAAKIADRSDAVNSLIKNTLGAEYRRLEKEGQKINQLSDQNQIRRAIEQHSEQLTDLLKKIASLR